MIQPKTKKSGFTIVELLIVIVVVGILAAITIVAYNGIQQRAQNAARVESARKILGLMRNYVIVNGSAAFKTAVPAGSGGVCLGEGFQDFDPGSANGCILGTNTSTGVTGYGVGSRASLDTALQAQGDYKISYPPIAFSLTSAGVTYNYIYSAPRYVYPAENGTASVDGKLNVTGSIQYHLQGEDQDCVLRPMWHSISTGVQTISDGVKNSNVNNGVDGFAGTGVTNCQLYFHPDAV